MDTENNKPARIQGSSIEGSPGEPPYNAQSVALPRPGVAVGWLMGIAAVYFIVTVVFFAFCGIVYALQSPGASEAEIGEQALLYATTPTGIAILYGFQFCLLVPMLLLIANFKEQAWHKTLAIYPLAWKVVGFWLLCYAIYQTAAYIFDHFFPIADQAFLKSINGTGHWGLSFTIVVLAPLLEEFVFRGYLWRGTWLGATGTIGLTSILFMAVHAGQYDLVTLSQLLIFSILLGVARERTGSVLAPVLMHMANNLYAAIVIVHLGLLGN